MKVSFNKYTDNFCLFIEKEIIFSAFCFCSVSLKFQQEQKSFFITDEGTLSHNGGGNVLTTRDDPHRDAARLDRVSR